MSAQVIGSMHTDGAVLLQVSDGQLFSTNPTGAHIWRRLEEHRLSERIAEEISRRYGIPRERALEDTARFIVELERQHLIERMAAQ